MQDNVTALQLFEKGVTKGEINNMALDTVESVLEKGNGLQVAEALSAMDDYIKKVRSDKRFVNDVTEQLNRYNGKFKASSGAKIEKTEAGTTYDFSVCNDPQIIVLQDNLDKAKKALEERQKFLKTIPYGGLDILVNEELVKLNPPLKTSTSTYKITLSQ